MNSELTGEQNFQMMGENIWFNIEVKDTAGRIISLNHCRYDNSIGSLKVKYK